VIHRFHDFELDEARHELRRAGQPVPLQPRVIALLFHLVRHRDRAVSKQELLDDVWDGAVVVEAALTRAASVLRSSLGDTDRERRLIVTVPGIGYRFAAEVDSTTAAPTGSAPAAPPSSETGSPPGRSAPIPPRVQARRELLERPALAILPFGHGGHEADHYFAEGMTEELTTALSCWKRFPVIGRRSANAVAAEGLGLQETAARLEARYVLEGTLRRSGDRLRITAALSDAEQGHQLWADRYERPLGDLFQVQDDICEKIVRGIEPELTRAEIDRALRKPPESLDAWDLCLRAGALMHEGTPDAISEAGLLLEQASSLDAKSPYVHSMIALHRVEEALFGWTEDPARHLARAQRAARDACRYDPRDWLAHALLGITTLWVDGDHARASDLVERAIELNPSGARAYQFLGCVLEFGGRPADAAEALQMALRLDPLLQSQALVRSDLALCHMLLGEYEQARLHCEAALDCDPHNSRALQRMLAILGHLGDVDEARQVLRRLTEVQPRLDVGYLEMTYPFARRQDRDHFFEGLEKAGAPLHRSDRPHA
jgi:TolB-like protein/DNA-binding winged helix-turn-helix (wHTH) protein/Flp pilus assembly protein TadD